MTAINYTIEVEQGSDLIIPVRWEKGGVPVDLSGSLIRCQLRQVVDSPEILDELTTTNGRITFGSEAGYFNLTFPASITTLWSFSRAVYDVEIVQLSGTVTRLMMGSVINSFEVTR